MIHTLSPANGTRRIAVIQAPRAPHRRLGVITDAQPYVSMVTISDQPISTGDQWLAQKIQEQAAATNGTPGTLTYTPMPTPPQPVARWNSWNGPCGPPPVVTPAAATPAPSTKTKWLAIAAALGAAASAVYLIDSVQGKI